MIKIIIISLLLNHFIILSHILLVIENKQLEKKYYNIAIIYTILLIVNFTLILIVRISLLLYITELPIILTYIYFIYDFKKGEKTRYKQIIEQLNERLEMYMNKRDIDDFNRFRNIALVYERKGDFKNASDYYIKALALSTDEYRENIELKIEYLKNYRKAECKNCGAYLNRNYDVCLNCGHYYKKGISIKNKYGMMILLIWLIIGVFFLIAGAKIVSPLFIVNYAIFVLMSSYSIVGIAETPIMKAFSR